MELSMRRCRPVFAAAVAAFSIMLSTARAQAPAAQEPLWTPLPVENHQVAAGRWRIPLNLFEPAGVDRVNEPVRCGVPVPRGALRDAAAVKLEDENGRERALQVEPGAWWPDGSFKWVILDFTIDLKAGEKKAYALLFGQGVSRAAGASPLKVTQDDEGITVDTGKLKFTMLKRKNVFINEAWLDANGDGKYAEDERVIAPIARGEMRGLFVDLWHKKRGAGEYWAALDPKPEEVKVEAAGPNCAEICFKGWHRATVGMDPWSFVAPRSWQYVLRVRAYAGSPTLRVYHTFVNTEDPLDIRVRAIGIKLPVAAGETPQYAFGATPNLRKTGGAGEEYYLVQEHWDSVSFEKGGPIPALKPEPKGDPVELMGRYQGGTVIEKAGACDRFADLSGPKAGVTVVFRDMEKLFPKELCLAGNDTIAYLWPAHKRPTKYEFFGGGLKSYMDLRQPNEIMYPDVVTFKEKYPGVYNKWMVGQDSDWERYGMFPNRCNALGVSKTHELIYDFHAGGVDAARAKALGAGASDPVQPYVTPQWYCWETEALGRMQPADTQNFPRMEANFNAFMDWVYRHQNEWSHLWGIFDYGCMQTYYDPRKANEKDYPFEELGPWGKLQGRYGWLNGEYDNDHDAFLQYFRGGRYADFKFASAYAAHHADVDTCHYNTDPAYVGAGHRHSILHWSDWLIDQQTYNDGMTELWYTTGNRRARDVALEVAGYSMYAGIPFRYFEENTGSGGTIRYAKHRGTWNKITNIARAYEMTADPEMRRHLEAWVRVIEANPAPWGGPAISESHNYLGACFPLVYRVTDSKAMAQIIIDTPFAMGPSSLGTFTPYNALRYYLTKDTGPFLSSAVWGVGWSRRKGEVPAEWKEIKKDTFTTGRTTDTLGWPHFMAALYDSQYDDRTPEHPAPVQAPAALPPDRHYQSISLRALMNEDSFGDMRTGQGLPWPTPGDKADLLDSTLGKAGGKIVICGSGEPGHKADQNITRKIKAGELPLTNWSIYPCYMFEPPVTRSRSPHPPAFTWGQGTFEIVDPRTNGGKSMIALKAGEKVTIPVGLKAHKLYFLGHVWAFRYPQDPGGSSIVHLLARTEVGRYRINYEGAPAQDVPIVNRVNASACIYGYHSEQARYVIGGPGDSGWPPAGGVCVFELDTGGKQVTSIEFSGTDPNRAVFLWAITAVTDGPSPVKPVKTLLFGGKNKPAATVDVVAGDAAADGKTGWVEAQKLEDRGAELALPNDYSVRTLRVAVPEDGWYELDLAGHGQGNAGVLNLTAGGRLALWSWPTTGLRAKFAAEARNGGIDLQIVTRPYALYPVKGGGNLILRSLALGKLPGPPAVLPEPMDLRKAFRYGWDSMDEINEGRGGCMYDNVLRLDVPAGEYKVSLKLNHSPISSAGVKCTVWAQDKVAAEKVSVVAREATTFNVSAPGGGIKLRIALAPKSSDGRIQQWAVDRVVIERVR